MKICSTANSAGEISAIFSESGIRFLPRTVSRTALHLIARSAMLAVITTVGCAHVSEKQTITAFQAGLAAEDLPALREKATPRFSERALRHQSAHESLTQLKIPDGKFKILDVEDVSKTEKKVTVGFGEDYERKILYRLVKHDPKQGWKVDDIFLRQRVNDKAIAMAVTEQMDVLLTAREFYETWSSGDRGRVLSQATPELAAELAKLPPAVLASTISKIMGSSDKQQAFRPEAHISGDEAVVKLNRSHGTLSMSLENEDAGWQVKDLSLKARGDEVGIDSLTEYVYACNQACLFLTAWNENDKTKLQEVTEPRFYQSGLAPANLQDFPLPHPHEISANIELKKLDAYTDIIVQNEQQTLRITLGPDADGTQKHLVSDVTIYNLQNQQTLALSAAMTARPVAELFMQALNLRDQKMLQFASTMDFNKRTWSRMGQQTMQVVPFPMDDLASLKMEKTEFAGNVTHVHFHTESQRLTVVLHDQNGKVVADDLLLSSLGESVTDQTSLKNYLAAVAPVYEFAHQIHNNQPTGTLRLVTDDFYDRVFSLTDSMPASSYDFLNYLSTQQPKVMPLASSSASDPPGMSANLIQPHQTLVSRHQENTEGMIVEFIQPTGSMKVKLTIEEDLLRIDDALLIGPDDQLVSQMKQTMRMEIAGQRTQSMIRTVNGEIRKLPAGEPQKMGAADPAGLAEMADTTLQNALYEEFKDQPGLNIQQTAGHSLQRTLPAVCDQNCVNQPVSQSAQSQPPSTMPPTKRLPVNPPQRLNSPEFLLLKPIPIQ